MSEDFSVRFETRKGLHDWLSRMPGRVLLEAEIELLNDILPNLFGYHLLQVGRLGGADMLTRSRILHRAVVDIDDEAHTSTYPSIIGSPDALPVASDSVDVVILPHILEYAPRPHDALREAERVLVPEGHLIVLGFNPWSWFGIWRLVLHRRGAVPWKGQFRGLSRIKDWIALLGFDVDRIQTHFFRPPLRSEGLMRRLGMLETLGHHLWPYLAGAYLLVAKKRVVTLTPMRPNWRSKPRLVAVGLPRPSTGLSHRRGSRCA